MPGGFREWLRALLLQEGRLYDLSHHVTRRELVPQDLCRTLRFLLAIVCNDCSPLSGLGFRRIAPIRFGRGIGIAAFAKPSSIPAPPSRRHGEGPGESASPISLHHGQDLPPAPGSGPGFGRGEARSCNGSGGPGSSLRISPAARPLRSRPRSRRCSRRRHPRGRPLPRPGPPPRPRRGPGPGESRSCLNGRTGEGGPIIMISPRTTCALPRRKERPPGRRRWQRAEGAGPSSSRAKDFDRN